MNRATPILSGFLLATFTFLALPGFLSVATATTAMDLSNRIVIDGFANEYEADETVFQKTPAGGSEEGVNDSKWGLFNDLNQIRITWDANFLYVAVEGFIFDNNTMLFFDTVESPDGTNPGLTGLTEVNSWRRDVTFDNGIYPDLFLATWDQNTQPQLWFYNSPNNVSQVPEGSFPTVATFSRDTPGRAMEAAIPWERVFLQSDQGERRFDEAYGDTVYFMPPRAEELKIVGWITTGADGLGGPDSAPDNLSGHQVDAANPVLLDNFFRIDLDRYNAAGEPIPDRVPDFGVQVRTPTTPDLTDEEYQQIVRDFFLVPPPVFGQNLKVVDLAVEPRAFAPELGETAAFRFNIEPRITDELQREFRNIRFTAELFDLRGRRVKTFYTNQAFTQAQLDAPEPPALNLIQGRDPRGALLDGGIYVLVVTLEPLRDQARQAVTVVR